MLLPTLLEEVRGIPEDVFCVCGEVLGRNGAKLI